MLRIQIILISTLLVLTCYGVSGQDKKASRKNPRYDRSQEFEQGATYPAYPVKQKKRKTVQNDYNTQFDQKVQEYYVRMEENAKRYRKLDKDMRRPQFADPTYFGHNRPPKKRPPGKKKFCKVCGMVH
jgi:hypothetical protein